MDSSQNLHSTAKDVANLYTDEKAQETIRRTYRAFLLEHSMSEIIQTLLREEINMHYCIVTDCTALLKTDMTLADLLFFHPDSALKVLDSTLSSVCQEVYTSHALKLQMTLKPNLHTRIKNIPVCPELWRERVPKSRDIGKFLAVEGTVIRTSSVKLLEFEKELTCSKCQCSFILKADFEQHYRIPTPARCPVRTTCNSKKFIIAATDNTSGGRKCKDFQEIKIQEQMRRLAMGTIPRAITVVLEDDLVDGCKAGDDVVIYGSLKCRWQQVHQGKACDIELVLKANYIEVRNEQRLGASVKEEMQNDFECFWAAHAETPMVARNHILASLCPQIYGLYVVKLAVALVLAGGVPRTDSSGSRVRGEAHLLLVGDPGTGKSQFLKYASKITPRSVLTTGIGSTSAGLTVTAIRDGPHWTLEAGALVLADGGICCIDEFSSIKEHDRGAIHEAMEQQTVSVAKAGLVCKLNTRTSVLAATNPKLGKYDESSSIDLNVAIASPLLSRFDIVLVLLDAKNELWDSVVADYVLTGKDVMNNNRGKQKLWSMDQMQAYFCCVKQINPVLTPSANRILSEYYRCHRRSDFRNAARTTIRLLESLIRIAEAHARLMYRQSVEVTDAIAAITIMESSMQGASLLPTGSVLHSCFPEDPEKEYLMHAEVVLNRLGLDDILQEEIASSPVKAGSLNRTVQFIPPESPFETKAFSALPQQSSSLQKQLQTKTGDSVRESSPSGRQELSFADFEKSINFRNIFDTSGRDCAWSDARTSTQNPSMKEAVEISPPGKKLCGTNPVVPGKTSMIKSLQTHSSLPDERSAGDEPSSGRSGNLPRKMSETGNESVKGDFRSRLLHFKRVTPGSSPEKETQRSGLISYGNPKIHNSKTTSDNFSKISSHSDTDFFHAGKEEEVPEFQTSTQSSSVTAEFDGHFSHPLDKNLLSSKEKQKEKEEVLPLAGKQSIFTLNASAVEEICDELALERGGFEKRFFSEMSDSQFVIPSTLQDQNSNHEQHGREDEPPFSDVSASKLFRIQDDDFENWVTGNEKDTFGFNINWNDSPGHFKSGKRKTFEL